MDPIEARKQKLLARGESAQRADQLRRGQEQATKVLQRGALAPESEPAEDLEAEQRALGMRPCDQCKGFFLPDRSTEATCKRCADAPQLPLFAPLKRGRSRTSTDYDEAVVLDLVRTLDLIASIVVVLSTVTGALVGGLVVLNSAKGVVDLAVAVFVILAGTAGGFAGFISGWLNVLAIRLVGQLSRCLVEIERNLERLTGQ